MALFENFPYTNLHELNLDWIIDALKQIQDAQVLSVNGETGHVILYKNESMQLPDVNSNVWQIIRTTDGVTAGIHFNSLTGIATIVNGNTLDAIYTHDNPPPYPVRSVNGETGDVTLYDEQYVRLPDLDDAQMTNWTLFRHLNTVSRGIQFDDDGSVYIIDGMNRYKVYTANDNPPYPVSSVNGQTGAVVLYQDQYVQLPPLDDPNMTEWTLFRLLNSSVCGLKLSDDGNVSVMNGGSEYPVYINGINEPSDFDDPTDALLELSDEVASADGKEWGMVRPIAADADQTVGIYFKYNTVSQEYETFLKVGATETKLLTAADIPPGSGVLSVNGQTGAVVLTGEDITVDSGTSTKIDEEFEVLEKAMATIVVGDTSTVNIAAGDLVLVLDSTITGISDGLFKAVSNVSAGTALTSADLDNTDTSKGGYNYFENFLGLKYNSYDTSPYNAVYKTGHVCYIVCDIGTWYNDTPGGPIRKGSLGGTPWVIPAGYRPVADAEVVDSATGYRIVVSATSGEVDCISDIYAGAVLRFSTCYFTN